MRTNDKNEVIITKKKAAELFVLLGHARYKLQGKMKSDAERYHKELETVFGLRIDIKPIKSKIEGRESLKSGMEDYNES